MYSKVYGKKISLFKVGLTMLMEILMMEDLITGKDMSKDNIFLPINNNSIKVIGTIMRRMDMHRLFIIMGRSFKGT